MTSTASAPAKETKKAKTPKSVKDLYLLYNAHRDNGKVFYERADAVLKKLVRTWKKNKKAKIDPTHCLEIEDQFRTGEMKVFAPAFAHRYKLKESVFEGAETD
jgi:hypothetical protein